MKVAITGARGFIGRRLVARHVAKGDAVRILTRVPAPEIEGIATTYRADLSTATPADLEPFAAGVDVLYHCAGELRDERKMRATHVRGTETLLQAAAGHVGRWVQLSSVGVYGPRRAGVITEESALRPVGEYETTKAIADDLAAEYASRLGLNLTVLRPSIVFGRDMPNRSLFDMIRAISRGVFVFVGERGASANYIPVDNVIDALILCGVSADAAGEVYNISDHCTVEEMVGVIARELDRRPPRFRFPERALRVAAWLTSPVPGFPLTQGRIDALVNRSTYPIGKIRQHLDYHHRFALDAAFADLTRYWMALT